MSDSLAASGAFLLPLESTGCGLDTARQAQAAARAFFDLPAEQKLAVGSPDCAGVARGYSGESHANIAFAADGDDQPAEDSKQAFTIGTNRYQWDGGAPAAERASGTAERVRKRRSALSGMMTFAMRFPLIRQNRSIFIGTLGRFRIYVYRLMGNAW